MFACCNISEEEKQSFTKAWCHLIFGLFFFVETLASNIFWAYKYVNQNSESWGWCIPVGISSGLLVVFLLLLFIIPCIRAKITDEKYVKLGQSEHKKVPLQFI